MVSLSAAWRNDSGLLVQLKVCGYGMNALSVELHASWLSKIAVYFRTDAAGSNRVLRRTIVVSIGAC